MGIRSACRSSAPAAATRRSSPPPARSPASNGGHHARRVYRGRQYGPADAGQPAEEGLHGDGLRHRAGGARRGSGARRGARFIPEAAAAGDLVITILPSSGNAEVAYLGAQGIIEGARRGRLCIDMSTIDPGTSQRIAARLAEKGIRFIDAPVSGGVDGATAGTLAIMVGGAAEDFTEAKPALDAMGANIIHVGAVGAGEVAKLCNNLIAGAA